MRFLVDQALSHRIASMLPIAGHDAVHVRDIGLATASDPVIFDRALADNRIIVTQDTDFGTLLVASGREKPSVILLRLHDGRPESQFLFIKRALDSIKNDLQAGAIAVLTETAVRVRKMT